MRKREEPGSVEKKGWRKERSRVRQNAISRCHLKPVMSTADSIVEMMEASQLGGLRRRSSRGHEWRLFRVGHDPNEPKLQAREQAYEAAR